MISTNAISIFILHHHKNGTCNKNLCLIQEIMRTIKPAFEKYKNFATNFPNLAILTKSAMPGEVQLTFAHVSVGNKSLTGSVVAFTLAGSLNSPSVVLIDVNIDFATDCDKICLPVTEVLLHSIAGNLTRLKKQQDWTPRNAVLHPQFVTEAEIINRGSDRGGILKSSARSVIERVEEGEGI